MSTDPGNTEGLLEKLRNAMHIDKTDDMPWPALDDDDDPDNQVGDVVESDAAEATDNG